MSFIWFFVRRLLAGAAVRAATNFAMRRFKLSSGAANIVFVVLTEVIARALEGADSKKASGKAPGRSGRR